MFFLLFTLLAFFSLLLFSNNPHYYVYCVGPCPCPCACRGMAAGDNGRCGRCVPKTCVGGRNVIGRLHAFRCRHSTIVGLWKWENAVACCSLILSNPSKPSIEAHLHTLHTHLFSGKQHVREIPRCHLTVIFLVFFSTWPCTPWSYNELHNILTKGSTT
ncbi:hypothetical protein F4810DRAFT_691391 [Camillea tinctor]|nr:hypothetical protein F4810DRAFT_691391 [Camillea tinctor]